jgi:hypothetical protein
MRLSVLLIALVVVLAIIFFPVQVAAQHGGSSGGGGGSHASSGGGYSSGSSASVSHATVSTSRASTSRTSTSVANSKGNASAVSHPVLQRRVIAKPSAIITKPTVCRGPNCPCLGGGSRNSLGNCAVQPQIANCPVGEYWGWNGYACGQEAFFNDCRALGDQVVGQQQRYLRMRSSREVLRYHLLNDQYERCMTAFHFTLTGLAGYDLYPSYN